MLNDDDVFNSSDVRCSGKATVVTLVHFRDEDIVTERTVNAGPPRIVHLKVKVRKT